MILQTEYDVIICGFGGAGAAAAIEAHDAGVSVLLLEKMSSGGGSTAVSGGSIASINDPARAVEHYLSLTEGRTPRAVLEAHVTGVKELPEWLAGLGADLQSSTGRYDGESVLFPQRHSGTAYGGHPHGDAIGKRLFVVEEGNPYASSALWSRLQAAVNERGIDILYSARALSVVRNIDGAVCGVDVGIANETIVLRDKRAVVLTCGGFAWRPEMLRENFGIEVPSLGPPGGSSGDGIDMARLVGADLWHMNGLAVTYGYKVPNSDAAWMAKITVGSFFIVDQKGKRFMDETRAESHGANFTMLARDHISGGFSRVPSYLIFDEAVRLAGPIVTKEWGFNRQNAWSDDNSSEIRSGWIAKGLSMLELGSALGLDADASTALATTALQYDETVSNGPDMFGRTSTVRLQGPYYGIPLLPVLVNTQGGPRRDQRSRVIGANGRPIPRLYSAGELGSIWASLYPGAGNLTEALVFGRIAGRDAAALDPGLTE